MNAAARPAGCATGTGRERALMRAAEVLLAVAFALGAAAALSLTRSAHSQTVHSAGLSSALTEQDFQRMLPATDMHSDAAAQNPHAHAFVDGPATPFDAASIPKNPLAPDALVVGAKTCVACHSLENVHASHSLHLAAFRAGAAGRGPEDACESCHGPGSAHAKSPTTAGLIIAFTHNSKSPIETQTGVCLGCHKGGARQDWIGSVHQSRGLACTDCHNPMARLSPEGGLVKSSTAARTCRCRKARFPAWIVTTRTAR